MEHNDNYRLTLTSATGQRIEILESENNIKLVVDDYPVVLIDDDAFAGAEADGTPYNAPGIQISSAANTDVARLSNGAFTIQGRGSQFFPATIGYKTNGVIFAKLLADNDDEAGISAAVTGIGIAKYFTLLKSDPYGGYFDTLRGDIIHGKVVDKGSSGGEVASDLTLTSTSISVGAGMRHGAIIKIKNTNSIGINIFFPSTQPMLTLVNTTTTTHGLAAGAVLECQYYTDPIFGQKTWIQLK